MMEILPRGTNNNDFLIGRDNFRGLRLLRRYRDSGFSKSVLNAIIDIFNYADALIKFTPVFMRFDFPAGTTSENIERFFDRLQKYHKRKDKRILYMYTREFEPINKHEHYHAFCIVNRREYVSARNIEEMLQEIWAFEIERNPRLSSAVDWYDREIHFTRIDPKTKYQRASEREHNPRRYNFYSLSTGPGAIAGDRDKAFEAASYLAKIEQIPAQPHDAPKRRRRGRSVLPKLNPEEIRPNYDTTNIKHFIADTPTLKKETLQEQQ